MKSWKVILIAVLAAAVIGAVVVGSVVRKAVVRAASEAMVEQLSGFDVSMVGVDVNLWKSTAEVTGLKVMNPPGYPERDAFNVKQIYIKYAPLSLLGNEVHLKELLVDIERVVVVRTAEGELNIERLEGAPGASGSEPAMQLVKAPATPASQPPTPARSEPEAPAPGVAPSAEGSSQDGDSRQIRIDDLTIKLGQISVRDYSTGGPEPIQFDHTVNEVIQMSDVTDMDQVAETVQSRLMASAFSNIGALAEQAISQFDDIAEKVKEETGVDVSQLGQLLSGAIGSAEDGEQEEVSSDEMMKAVGNLLQNFSAPPAE